MMTENITTVRAVSMSRKRAGKTTWRFQWVPVECSLPFMCEDDANKLDRVLKGLPTNIAAIKFDSVYRVAQLVQIWPREDLPERAKLMEMAKQQDISAEALEVSRELLAFPV